MKTQTRFLNLLLVFSLLVMMVASTSNSTAAPAADVDSPSQVTATQMPPPIRQWAGLSRLLNDPADTDIFPPAATDLNEQTIIGAVPDTSGAVGFTHYLQAVNEMVALYEKDGTLVERASFAEFWTSAAASIPAPPASACLDGAFHHGQPYVIFDHLAGRWVVADVAYENIDTGPYYICLAVSRSNKPVLPDPVPAFPLAPGTYFGNTNWYYYALSTNEGNFHYYPDMIKLALWPDGYYLAADMYDVDSLGMYRNLTGAKVWAVNRSDLVGGLVNTFRYVPRWLPEELGYEHLAPSNLLGTAPPNGTPNYFASIQPSAFHIWTFKVNWLNLAASTFGKPAQPSEPNYTLAANTGSLDVRYVVPQVGTDERVDAHGDRLMSPLQYRVVNGVPSLWANYTVQPGGEDSSTGIRWHEVQFAADGTPNFVQNGLHRPDDPRYRWLGSLAVDRAGNMALGFSISEEDAICPGGSCQIYPSIAYAGRLRRDPAGTLPLSDNFLWKGTGSQFDSAPPPADLDGWDGPWGRQSQMSIDPLDNCVFWYTNMYYDAVPITQTLPINYDWKTRIGFFALKECRDGSTRRVSLHTNNTQGNLSSGQQFEEAGRTVAISANGRYVAFASEATNLVNNDTNGKRDVFVRDRDFDNDGIYDEAGAVETVCITCATNGDSWEVAINGTGRYIAFASSSSNFPGISDTNGAIDIYRYDRMLGTFVRVSVTDGTANGQGLGGEARHPSISYAGDLIAFDSNFSNLVPSDKNDTYDVFVRTPAVNDTMRVSMYNLATPPPAVPGELLGEVQAESRFPSISPLGNKVAYQSRDIQLAPTSVIPVGDANPGPIGAGSGWDVFLVDSTGVVSTTSVTPGGTTGLGDSYAPFLSNNSQVVFASRAPDLVTPPEVDSNGYADIFVYDALALPIVTRVSVNFFGGQAINGDSYYPSISADGKYVAFTSNATNLDAFLPDVNGKRDVFLFDRGQADFGIYDVGLTTRISLDYGRSEPNGNSVAAVVAGDGGHVAFVSEATDLVTNDTNNRWDVFAYTEKSELPIFLKISGNVLGTPGQTVVLPVTFTTNGYNIDALTFAIDYDQACLEFVPAVDAVIFNVPGGYDKSYEYDPAAAGGELTVQAFSTSVPVSNLIDGTLMTIKFKVLAACQSVGGSSTTPVSFSLNPPPSFGAFGQNVPGATQDGFVTIGNGLPGDCNGDGARNAGDMSAIVKEIFDNDGVLPENTPGGTYAGNAVGCNPNLDNEVGAADISCTVRLIFGHSCGGARPALSAAASTSGISLALPALMPVRSGDQVVLPLTLAAEGQALNSTVFSLDYDQTWLSFDGADVNHDGLPDGLSLQLPPGFVGLASFDPADTQGELDLAIFNPGSSLATLPDGVLAYITFTASSQPGTFTAVLRPAQDLPASFGDTGGRSLPGQLTGGDVMVGQWRMLYLPLLRR